MRVESLGELSLGVFRAVNLVELVFTLAQVVGQLKMHVFRVLCIQKSPPRDWNRESREYRMG